MHTHTNIHTFTFFLVYIFFYMSQGVDEFHRGRVKRKLYKPCFGFSLALSTNSSNAPVPYFFPLLDLHSFMKGNDSGDSTQVAVVADPPSLFLLIL